MKIEINNLQKVCRPNLSHIKNLVRLLMERAVRLEPGTRWGDVSVVLVDNEGIRALKAQFMNRDEVTDVLSLRYEAIPGTGAECSGEVIVNVQRAILYGQRRLTGWNASRELALYLAHGCDHLMNSTDDDAAGYKRMRRRELRWLNDPAIIGVSTRLLHEGARRTRRLRP